MIRPRFRTLSMLSRRERGAMARPPLPNVPAPPSPTTVAVYLERAGVDPVEVGTCRICYRPGDRDLMAPTYRPLPIHEGAPPLAIGEVRHVTFPIRQVVAAAGGMPGEPAVMVHEGDDPSILPGWAPAPMPRASVTAYHRRGQYHVRMDEVSSAEFAALPSSEPGLPRCWVQRLPPAEGIDVWPGPSTEFEVRTQVWPDRQYEQAQAQYLLHAMVNAWPGNGPWAAAGRGRADLVAGLNDYERMRRHTLGEQWAEAMLRQQAEQVHYTRAMNAFLGGTTIAPGATPVDQRVLDMRRVWEQQQLEFLRAAGVPGGWFGVDLARAARYPRIDGETAARSRERARGLLKSLITPEQWTEFERAGVVRERIGECEFVLRSGGEMIQALKPRKLRGPVRERWCISPDPYADGNDWMPDEDKLIGQLLHLRAGPDKLRAAANVFAG